MGFPKAAFLTGLFVVAPGISVAQADGIWQWTFEGSASATANVLDGGPPVARSGQTDRLDEGSFTVSATDQTGSGSLSAIASASGRSSLGINDKGLGVGTRLDVGYLPSFFPGGANPGGEAMAEISSMFEVVLPFDMEEMIYFLDIDEEHPDVFSGSALVVIENVTQAITLVEQSQDITGTILPINALAGDVIRITTTMSGQGMAGPGSARDYGAIFRARFPIPEPSAVFLLLVGCAIAHRPKRDSSRPLNRQTRVARR